MRIESLVCPVARAITKSFLGQAGGFRPRGPGSRLPCRRWRSRSTTVPTPSGPRGCSICSQALGARATFFPIAARAAEHPAIIERMRAEGHAIGLHCDRARPPQRARRGVAGARHRRGAGASRRPGGDGRRFWRTPWGDTAPWSTQVARDRDLRLIGWTADTHDWRGDSRRRRCSRPRARRSTDGAIVLAHDGLGPGRPARQRRRRRFDYVALVGRARPRATVCAGGAGVSDGHVRPSSTWPASTTRWRGSAASAGERDRRRVPPFPEEAIADLEAAGALAWNAQPGDRPAAGGRRARAGAQRRAGRRLGRPDPRRASQRGRAAGGPGAGGAARPRAGGGARRAGCASACGAATRARARARRRRWSARPRRGAHAASRRSARAPAASTARWCSPATPTPRAPAAVWVDLTDPAHGRRRRALVSRARACARRSRTA